ncbi:SusC/RagA family TonB-linked outer membrane protein [Mucilaginibacter sp. cycad4]|uniref:SusC/RagA family TonB-linked outer membrane protein n=1 Tax=Mucilaginibacter sp. cycad4 TaxID=3342096 RepID=UPI002AAC1654|nr:SusC/RagA family TonB-linked outer membrane protein [Mucilaginibacter gossypii]WPU99049.1 SusC/RagA family TonB-linked outer membrane protein [Mucilaginibacter gossypii]
MKISDLSRCGPPAAFSAQLLRVMKITTFLLITFLINVSAASRAQITLVGKKITLQNALNQIRKQSGYDVIFTEQDVARAHPFDISLRNVSLQKALSICFAGQPLDYAVQDNTVMIKGKTDQTPAVNASSRQVWINVHGRVLNDKGEPLSGATIKTKGVSLATLTDTDGRFYLSNVNADAVLTISYVGYASKELMAKQVDDHITLQLSSTKLDEVKVTTAYGIERNKKELGYSVATVSGAEINKANSGNILNGIIGKISGLNIDVQNSAMTPQIKVLLRGIRSFGENSNNSPLFVLNGAPLSFGSDNEAASRVADFINNLNPSDVEDVTVLKGANGTALYGPEGVNGVIIITTKKGKSGETAINFRTNLSFNKLDFSHLNRQDIFGLGNDINFSGGQVASNWGPAYDGRIVSIGYPDEKGNYQKVPYIPRDDYKKFFNVAQNQRYNLSLASGERNSSFYLGLGYLDQKGLLPGDKNKQATVLLSTSRKINSALNVLFNVNYSRTDVNKSLQDVTAEVLTMPTFIPLLDYKDYVNSHWAQPDNYWNFISPYQRLAIAREKKQNNSVAGNITVNLKIAQWLSAKNVIGINYADIISKKTSTGLKFANYARVNAQKYVDIDPHVQDEMLSYSSINNDFLLSGLHTTGDFVIRWNIGSTLRQNYNKGLFTDASLVVPVYNLAFVKNTIKGEEGTTLQRSISALGTTSLGYKDKIFLEFTGRNEWDSRRAEIARGKDLYISANSSILLKKIIPYLAEQDWLSAMQLRSSLSSTANMNIEPQQSERILSLVLPYPYTTNSSSGALLGFGGAPPSNSSTLLGYGFTIVNPNPNIKPEKVFSQEYGINVGLLKNRVQIDASYYHQVNDGVILQVANSWLSGYPTFDNAGKFQNTGWEFDLNFNPLVDFGDFKVGLKGYLAINNNKVLKVSSIYNGRFQTSDPTSGVTYYASVGHSAYEFAIYDWIRDPQGRVVVDASTGLPSVDYQNPKAEGRTLPIYTGSLNLNVSWKRFNLSALANYSGGNDHLFNTQNIASGADPLTLLNNREKFVFPNSVIQDRPGHYIPNTNVAVSNIGQDLFTRFSNVTRHGLTNAAYWKIREVALQYELPVSGKFIKGLSISIYGRDLFSFYPSSNIHGDPTQVNGPAAKNNNTSITAIGGRTTSSVSNTSGAGSDPNTLPGSRLFGIAVGANF